MEKKTMSAQDVLDSRAALLGIGAHSVLPDGGLTITHDRLRRLFDRIILQQSERQYIYNEVDEEVGVQGIIVEARTLGDYLHMLLGPGVDRKRLVKVAASAIRMVELLDQGEAQL